jgi:hypothetical protein
MRNSPLLVCVGFWLLVVSANSATYSVTSTADSGPGSLRQALLDANVSPGMDDRIEFNIPRGGPYLISLMSNLPVITDTVEINGFSQPGASPNTGTNSDNAIILVQLDGTALGTEGRGLEFSAGSNVVRGLSLTGFGSSALFIGGSGGNVVAGCRVGMTPADQPGTNRVGITVQSPDNRVGGTAPAERNLVGGNERYGVILTGGSASNNVVAGNFIGLIGPTTPFGNGRDGVAIALGNNNVIGGTPEEGNLIAFNLDNGVRVISGEKNIVQGNRFFANGLKLIAVASGANRGIQAPVLTSVLKGSTHVEGTFQGEPFTSYFLEAVASDPYGDPTHTYDLGTFVVMTDAAGKADYKNVYEFTVPNEWDVRVSATDPSAGTSEFSSALSPFPVGAVDLSLLLTGPFSAQPNEPLTYTLTVRNEGPTVATTAELFMALGLPFFEVESNSTPVVADIENGRPVVSLGTIQPGASITLTAKGSSPVEGVVPVAARVGATQPDRTPDNNLALLHTFQSATGIGVAADLQVEFPDLNDFDMLSARELEPQTFRVRVTNNGPAEASGVTLKLYVSWDPRSPVKGHLSQVSSTAGTASVNAGDDGRCRCDVPTLGVGQSVDMTVHAVWDGTTSDWLGTSIHAVTTSKTFDPQLENNTAFAPVHVVPLGLQHSVSDSPDKTHSLNWAKSSSRILQQTDTLNPPVRWTSVPEDQIVDAGQILKHIVLVSLITNPKTRFFRLMDDPPTSPELTISQMDMILGNGLFLQDSERGQATLRYMGSVSIPYVTVWHDGVPVVTDAPVLSPNGAGTTHSMVFTFPLGSSGSQITSGQFAFRIAEMPGDTTVPPMTTQPVGRSGINIRPGETAAGLPCWSPLQLSGSAVQSWASNPSDFPLHEQGPGECIPAGLADGLEYLNARNQLGIDPIKINVDKLKQIFGWCPVGVSVGNDSENPQWAQELTDYLATIDSPISNTVSTDPTEAMKALTDAGAVSIRVAGHSANLRAMAKMDGARYALVLSHDLQQGEPGGTTLETVFYDSATGALTGGAWTQDRTLTAFVIQRAMPQ